MTKRIENAYKLLSDYLQKSAREHPDRNAIVYGDQHITYREFNEKTEILAKYLLSIGVKRQDRIAYIMEIQPEFFYLYMAAARVGAIIVGIGTRLMPPEMEHIINSAEAEYVFITGGDRPYVEKLSQTLPQCPTVSKVVVVGDRPEDFEADDFAEIIKEDYAEFKQALIERESQVETDDGLLMVFTSGTTGQPKGALLSHRNIIHSSLIEADTFESTPDDVYLNNMPINHVGGAIVAGSTPIVSASTMVLLAKFSPTKTLQLIEQEGVSVLGQIPTQYTMEFNVPDYDKYDKSSLRVVHFGGSMPPKTTLRKVHASMCENMFNCLGMTEAAGIVSYTPKGASIEVLSKSVGKGIPEVEWKLVDKKRRPVRRGEVGEIAYRGSTIIKEYYKLPQATAEAIDDEGWFYAGDLFYEDENGLLIFMGRKHDMFITGGENVYPAEVEKAISSYEKVQTVAVVPVKDDVYGEIGCAYIIPKPGYTMEEEEITTFLKAKLAKYKIPKKFIFREALPLNATGKVDKKMLKKKIAEEIQALSS